MKKDYIRDNGKIRECVVNTSKMTILEYVYYEIFYWGFFKQIFYKLWKALKEFIKSGFHLITGLMVLILFPIVLPIAAHKIIKDSKKMMKY